MKKMQEINVIKPNGSINKVPQGTTDEGQPIDIHTEDLQEIITKVPGWILRWGITVFFGILLMFIAISVFVRYPDTIKGDLKLNTSGTLIFVNTAVTGRVVKLSVKQGAVVKQGQPLAVITTSDNAAGEYTLTAPGDGKIGFIGILQQGSFIKANQEVFIIHPDKEPFFGIMQIPANSINKIKIGQQVLINLRNYPAEEYGQLKGAISYIADEPGKDGFFSIKITLNSTGLKRRLVFKSWITGDAEIITENLSLQSRIYKSLMKGLP